jgi:hypothetical protein
MVEYRGLFVAVMVGDRHAKCVLSLLFWSFIKMVMRRRRNLELNCVSVLALNTRFMSPASKDLGGVEFGFARQTKEGPKGGLQDSWGAP